VWEGKVRHSYPHCWRCKDPVLFRATSQWFLSVEKNELRKKLLSNIESVTWIPSYGKNRIRGMVQQRPDWCLSRQRLWGTPIPIFYCETCRTPLLDDQAIGMVEEIVGLEGSDSWFKNDASHFLQTPFQCGKCGGKRFARENDILDVWFDSGVSHEAILKGETKTCLGVEWKEDLSWPADLYLEGSDQHRGWFQTSLIPSVALHEKSPYQSVLTHGFIVDGQGKKMSKSLGNVIAPEQVLKIYGADILRLWVAASDYREDIRLSDDILKGVAESYRKFRNSIRYLIGNISDFRFANDSVPYAQMLEVDRWVLGRLSQTIQNCQRAYDQFEFHRVAVSLLEFCAIDCSSFYFDVLKDRLYTFGKNSPERRSAQTALYHILSSLLPVLAPILSFTSEEVWQLGLQEGYWSEETVFLKNFPAPDPLWKEDSLQEKWIRILRLREKVNSALELARKNGLIGGSLESKVIFSGGSKEEKEILQNMGTDLPMVFIVSQVERNNGDGELSIAVQKASGSKCLRCWRYVDGLSVEAEQSQLCPRCLHALQP
ncbi:MAG: class I tRNA ligase family protein, partial [Elusimicrobia bacterium]|nr:class I tRNA ligase family protein [Elusimicrobiota bacterium]